VNIRKFISRRRRLLLQTGAAFCLMSAISISQADAQQTPAPDADTPSVNQGVPGVVPSPAATTAAKSTGPSDAALKFTWTNTLKYSVGMRVKNQDPALDGLRTESGANDGDRSFDVGDLIENRVDLLSQIDLTGKYYGFRLSGSAWYDLVYNQPNAIPASGYGSVNWISAPPFNFPLSTRNIMGQGALLGDAFTYANGSLGPVKVNARVGQFSMLWGQSLILSANAIAGTMVPINIPKASAVPNSQFQEIAMGVPQASLQFQLTPTLSTQMYYQFEWRKNIFNPVGSYFSTTDTFDAGGERLLTGAPGLTPQQTPGFFRGADQKAPNTGQYGIDILNRFPGPGIDLGLYFVTFNSRAPELAFQPGLYAGLNSIGGSTVLAPSIGRYYFAYATNIRTFGLSLAKSIGDFSFAGEVSERVNQDLTGNAPTVSITGVFGPPGTPSSTLNLACAYNNPAYLAQFAANKAPPILSAVPANNTNNPCYPIGNTLHADGNFLWQVPPNFIAADSSLLLEIGFNHLLGITANPWMVDTTGTTRNATAMALVFTPTYHQIVPRLELSVPVTLSVGLQGKSYVYNSLPAGGVGTATIGLTAVWNKTWSYGVNYTNFLGPKGPQNDPSTAFSQQQDLADRNFVSAFVSRTF
jgi:hypothetical protein